MPPARPLLPDLSRSRFLSDPRLWVAGVCVLSLGLGWAASFQVDALGDEGIHSPQIRALQEGRWKLHPNLSMLPGYHLLVATVLRHLGIEGLDAARTVNVAISAWMLLIAGALASRLHSPATAAVRVLHLAFLPILFPFLFLVYTDVTSLLAVLLAVLWADRPRPVLAPLATLAAVLVRQSNLVWVFFIAAVHLAAMARNARTRGASPPNWDARMRQAVPYGGILIAVLLFVAANGGLALGNVGIHPTGSFHGANVWFGLGVLLVCYLPLHLPRWKQVAGWLGSRIQQPGGWRTWVGWVGLLGLCAVVGGLLVATFQMDHPYNQEFDTLRNELLRLLVQPVGLVVLTVVVVAALLALAATPMQTPTAYLLYPLTVLFLSAHWLVEQRYMLIPLAL